MTLLALRGDGLRERTLETEQQHLRARRQMLSRAQPITTRHDRSGQITAASGLLESTAHLPRTGPARDP